MAAVTLEQTHAVLVKLAEYVMTQAPTRQELTELRREMEKRLGQVESRLEQVERKLRQVDKRSEQFEKDLLWIRSQVDLVRAEQRVFVQTFELHHKRLLLLEDESAAYRVKDVDAEKKLKS